MSDPAYPELEPRLRTVRLWIDKWVPFEVIHFDGAVDWLKSQIITVVEDALHEARASSRADVLDILLNGCATCGEKTNTSDRAGFCSSSNHVGFFPGQPGRVDPDGMSVLDVRDLIVAEALEGR